VSGLSLRQKIRIADPGVEVVRVLSAYRDLGQVIDDVTANGEATERRSKLVASRAELREIAQIVALLDQEVGEPVGSGRVVLRDVAPDVEKVFLGQT